MVRLVEQQLLGHTSQQLVVLEDSEAMRRALATVALGEALALSPQSCLGFPNRLVAQVA
jgi:hypothetical protein